jgi:HK97 family phage major capsid protein
MGKLVQLREEMTKVLTDLKGLQEQDERSTDDETKLDQLLARANELGPEIQREKALEDQAKQLDDYTKPAPNGRVTRQETAQNRQRPVMANLGRSFVKSDTYAEYAANPRGKSGRFDFGSRYVIPEDDDMEQRTLIYTGATANLVNGDRLAGIYRPALMPFQVQMRDVLISAQTESNAVEYVQELAYTNTAAETAEAVSTATGAKPESALTFQVTTANVKTIAHWVPITRQTLQDASQLESYTNNRLLEGLKFREDSQIVAGDGTGANLTGLMNTSGIGNLDAAYWTANPLPTAGAAATSMDRIRRAVTYVRTTGFANPSFVVINPADAEKFDIYKSTQGVYLLGNPLDYTPVQRLWGLTVVQSTSITALNFLVGDGAMAAIFDRMDAQVFVADQHSDFFIRNIFVLLAEERIALAVFRPAAFAKGVMLATGVG